MKKIILVVTLRQKKYFCFILTVSTNKVKMFVGRKAPWTVTSRVANSLFWGASLLLPVRALIREVLPQLVYPMTATLACLFRPRWVRANSRCFAIFSISFFMWRSLLKIKQSVSLRWCDCSYEGPMNSTHDEKLYRFNMNLWRSKWLSPFRAVLSCLEISSISKSPTKRERRYGISASWTLKFRGHKWDLGCWRLKFMKEENILI